MAGGPGSPRGQLVRSDEGKALEAQVLAILRSRLGRAKKIKRAELVWTLRTCGFLRDISDEHADRKAREAIESLRKTDPEGGRILSSSDVSGYWLSDDPEEIAAAIAEDLSRIDVASQKISNRRRALDAISARPLVQERLI